MGSTVITDTDYQAFVEPNGNVLIFSFLDVYESDSWSQVGRWRMTHAGRVDDTLQRIGHDCARIEDGSLQIADRNRTEHSDARVFAEQRLAALRSPVSVIELPETTTIGILSFDSWHYKHDSMHDMRREYALLLDSTGLRTESDRTVRVDQNIDLLLRFDELALRCHDAWPDKRMPPIHRVTPLGPELPGKSHDSSETRILRIEDAPMLMLTTHSDNRRASIKSERDVLKEFWTTDFPVAARHQSWRADFDAVMQMLNSDSRISAASLVLHKPVQIGWKINEGCVLWRRLVGDDRDEITMQEVVQQFGAVSLQTERLAGACVLSIEPPDQRERDDESYGPR